MRKFGFYFSELIVTTILYALIMGYFAAQGYVFNTYNREISGVIFLLFGIGITIVTYHLLKLYREDRQISIFYEQLENFRSATNRLLEKRQTLSPEMTANTLRKAVDEHFAILNRSLLKEWVYKILNMTLTANKPDPNALSSLLQQRVEVGGNRIRYIAGILIMLGLLGTFLGLMQSIKYLQHFFTASRGVDVNTLFSDMKQTLGGLDKAFGTSIGGIMAYLVLGYLNIVLRTKQAYILNQIEETVLEHILPIMQGFQVEERQDLATTAINTLRTIPKTVSEQLSRALEGIMQQTIGGSTEDLKTTSVHLQAAAEGIQQGQAMFTETLSAFGDFLSVFQESKDQLLSSQQTLASGVKAFFQEIALLKEQQQMLGSSLEMMKEYLAHSETRFSSLDEVVQHMHTIWTDNRQVFAQLAETIQNEHETLVGIVQHLEEFLRDAKTASLAYFQRAQEGVHTVVKENTEVNRTLLESYTMLTTLLHDMQRFILDEHKGLSLLSDSLKETFGEARFQYAQLTEQVEELHKRMLDSQEQLVQLQETTTAIQQQLQMRRNT